MATTDIDMKEHLKRLEDAFIRAGLSRRDAELAALKESYIPDARDGLEHLFRKTPRSR